MNRLAIFVLVGLASVPRAAESPAERSFDLYSWRCEPDWCYALVASATPRPNEEEVLSRPAPLRGEAFLAELARLPRGAGLRWLVPFTDTRQAYPPKDTVALIRRASAERELRFYGPEGPLEEVTSDATARRAGWGERVYYLDHRWVALPDFEIRYLRTDSRGSQPPYAVFSQFEVRRGERRQTIETDPNFGAWTPTRFELEGKAYVLEVDLSDVLRTGSNHGDLYAWPAAQYAERLDKVYGRR